VQGRMFSFIYDLCTAFYAAITGKKKRTMN
jgi:hypothetical protein